MQLADALAIAISRQQLHELELAKLGFDATTIGPVASALQRDERLVRVRCCYECDVYRWTVQVVVRLPAHHFQPMWRLIWC